MPWQETRKMDQRIEFALKAMKTDNFRELCREYGISPKTGYKWRARFLERGLEGMSEESRRPHAHARELPEAVVCRMVALKNAHPHWGPRKIRELYARAHRSEPLPSESSFKRVLERSGLTRKRRARPAQRAGRLAAGRRAEAPNEVWSVDFKGWWLSGDGLRVEPLTVRDEFSRMLLELHAVESSRTEVVRSRFEHLFEAHGLPLAIRSDNGPPFALSHSLLGLTQFSVWLLALGIDLERGRPGCPQDNGAHERMHLDVRRELQAGRIGRDQPAFDLWRESFNNERPHEALGMKTPAEVYTPSPRRFEGTAEGLDYGSMDTRRVHPHTGNIKFRGSLIRLSSALGGWEVGLAPRPGDGLVDVHFAHLILGQIDPKTRSFQPVDGVKKDQKP